MKEKLKQIISKIKPSIQAHGGDIEFVDFDEEKKIVKVRLYGACVHCPMSEITLKAGVLESIKEKIPEIKGIENIA
ncbi:MAG: hypothetical protein COU51_02415 [Parcubacteria group bacterium CG10_big_fil_rev_8_21_14_0_10_36_14]|nr:MAG: hypothetical protein COU51_02415 [Parcubacteria group bacterium CG10_big_fil_rev_8_21_14_0_10_36_14]